MKYFQRLTVQLKQITKKYEPGKIIKPPKLMPHVKIKGKKVSYIHMGAKNSEPAIIFIHGFGGFFMDWPRIMTPLSKQFHVIALDLPGWGFSEPRDDMETIEDDPITLELFLNKLKIKSCILVGISYGAAVCWVTAARGNLNIKEMLLLNPMPPHPLRYITSPLYRFIFQTNRIWPLAKLGHKLLNKMQYKLTVKENIKHQKLIDTFYLKLGFLLIKQPHLAKIFHKHAIGAVQTDWDEWIDKIKNINIPTTILRGLDDQIFDFESARFLHELIKGSHLYEVPDCGHAMVFDQPHRVIRHFLNHEEFGDDEIKENMKA